MIIPTLLMETTIGDRSFNIDSIQKENIEVKFNWINLDNKNIES